jgi:fumarylpyruvate hydrolase
MIWPVADIISHVSQAVVIKPGDLIFSGTPAGVGALKRGDTVTGGVEGVAEFQFEIGTA